MVAPIDVDQAHEAQFLRIALECEVSRTIALDPAAYDLATPERLLEDMHRAWDSGQDKPAFIASDLGYHRAMFRTDRARGPLGARQAAQRQRRPARNLHLPEPGKAAQILAAHHAHLDALKAGDEVEAQRVMRRHLTGTLGKARELRETHRQFFY